MCPFFKDDRKKYLTDLPSQPDIHYLISLFDNPDQEFVNRLIKFIKLIMTIFDNRDEWEDGI